MKTTTVHKKALEYVLLNGYSIIPVGKDKRPLLSSWKEYQTRLPTEEEIENWFIKKYPEANIGIVTGKISNIIIVDVDLYKGVTADYKFPKTYTVQTGNKGLQLYYQYTEGFTISADKYPQFPHVDIRSDGGYAVAPPSITAYSESGVKKGGEYTVLKNIEIAKFPLNLFKSSIKTNPRRKLSSKVGIQSGSRNDSITSLIGQLLSKTPNESEWESEVWPAIEMVNKTYTPPLPQNELRTTFESIMNRELDTRKKMTLSPIQLSTGEVIDLAIRKNRNGSSYKDMANVLAVLSVHPKFKGKFRFNEFKLDIEFDGKPLQDADIVKIQYFMQTEAELHTIAKSTIEDAIQYYAHENSYDEAKDWIKSLEWDGELRLKKWINSALNVDNDDYYEGIGMQWFTGMVKRIMDPGATFDYMLVLVGPQGIGKTSLFRILGGKWYKSYTGDLGNKDFYLVMRGAIIVDLDEGATLNRSDSIKMKSLITETHDEFRAPYGKVTQKYPRRFVFSMSTNDTEPFRDVTGNRRYWTIDCHDQVNFKWLEENREQLFAECYHYYKNNIPIAEVPIALAKENQEAHLPEDSWTDLVVREVTKSYDYCNGSDDFNVTILEIYAKVFPDESLARVTKFQEMRISNIFKKELGLEKKRKQIEGSQKSRWYISEDKKKLLRNEPLTPSETQEEKEIREF